MANKNNPGMFRCYEAALPDEPMFVLLGRDPAAPATMEFWATERRRLGKVADADDRARIEAALTEADDMRAWRAKVLDHADETGGPPAWRLPRPQEHGDDRPIREKFGTPQTYYDYADAEHRNPVRVTPLDFAQMVALLDMVTTRGQFDEDTTIDDVLRGAIWAVKRCLGLLPPDSAIPYPQPKTPEVPVYKGDGLFAVPGVKEPQSMEQIAAAYDGKLIGTAAGWRWESPVAEKPEEPKVAFGEPYRPKSPTVDSKPEDLAHAPEVPAHRFSAFHTSGDYAYARGLEVSPVHLPTALDAMERSGWRLVSIFGQTDAQHVGFIFRRVTIAASDLDQTQARADCGPDYGQGLTP